MKNPLLTTVFLLTALFCGAQSGSVTVTSVQQRSDGCCFVDVYFNLHATEGAYTISLEVSFDGGNNYTNIHSDFLTGDVSIRPGNNKHIVWDGLKSFPDIYSTQTKLKLIAKNIYQPCPDLPTVTDADGNVYYTVLIGSQCWMKENLKTTKYSNGTPIDSYENIIWPENTTGAYAWWDNDIWWKQRTGALYNGYATLNPNGLCPEGWHVPSYNDWMQLVDYVVSFGYSNKPYIPGPGAGSALKSCLQVNSPLGEECIATEPPLWAPGIYFGYSDEYGFDAFGFSALGGGELTACGWFNSEYGFPSSLGLWWSSTNYFWFGTYHLHLSYGCPLALLSDHGWLSLNTGMSVRCLQTPPDTYYLNLEISPQDAGFVDGADHYLAGEDVLVFAHAEQGWGFINWTDDLGDVLSEEPVFVYIMPANNVTLTANFGHTLSLLASPEEGGYVSGAGVYSHGDEILVDANPFQGWEFVNWTDPFEEISEEPSFIYTMPENNITLTAHFEMIDFTLSVIALPAEGGIVLGSGTYNFEDEIQITASSNLGWEFINWTNGGIVVSEEPVFTYIMPASDIILTANFEMTYFTLTLISNPFYGGSVSGSGTYNQWDEIQINAFSNQGWVFVNWTDTYGLVSAVPNFTYTMPAEDITLTANFIEVQTGFICGISTISDIDGNIYNTVQIGDQCWMAENLKTTKHSSGYNIERKCYNNDNSFCDWYGGLYYWETAMDYASGSNSNPSGVQGICPTGWHLPSAAEWDQLIDYVVLQGYPNHSNDPNGAGNALKSCRQVNSPLGGDCNTTEHPRWDSHSLHNGFDEFGFSALPGGFLWLLVCEELEDESYNFISAGSGSNWWSTSSELSDSSHTATVYLLGIGGDIPGYEFIYYSNSTNLSTYTYYSVRCVKD